jgi:hypothetical protein
MVIAFVAFALRGVGILRCPRAVLSARLFGFA